MSDRRWKYRDAHPDLAAQVEHLLAGTLPEDGDADIPTFEVDAGGLASGDSGGKVLNAVVPKLPWLLDLAAAALTRDQMPEQFSGQVADSGEGHWAIEAAMEDAVPVNVLFARYRSRIEHSFGDKMLSAMRFGFGGHVEIPQ